MNYREICKEYKLESLRGANLSHSNLQDADLQDADLSGANLRGANLRGANLRGANLRDADLRYADLSYADLHCADLCGADLRDADLRNSNLCDADLVVIYGEVYFISICRGTVRAGCQSYTVEEWRSFSKRKVISMDGRNSLNYYPRLLDIIDFYCGKGSRPEWLAKK